MTTTRSHSRPLRVLLALAVATPVAAVACSEDSSSDGAAARMDECEEMNLDEGVVCTPDIVQDDGTGFIGDGETNGPSGPGNGTASGEVDESTACADSNTYVGRSEPAALQLLVDTSCSMAQSPGQGNFGGGQMGGGGTIDGPASCPDEPDDVEPFDCGLGGAGEGSKWQITRDALVDALDGFGDTTWMGLMFYPFPPSTPADQVFAGLQCECHPDVDVFLAENTVPAAALTAGQADLLRQALDDAFVTGSTPTHAAYGRAVEYLRNTSFNGPKYVVLLTDGEPTYGLTDDGGCYGIGTRRVDSTALIADVTAAYAAGIHTFVIGSPGSEGARVDLSRMAEEGGTARADCSSAQDSDLFCHLDMTTERDFGVALAAALGQVAEQTADPCSYRVPMPSDGQSIDRSRVNVSYTDPAGTPVELPNVPTDVEDCEWGWQYSDDQNSINLCAETCSTVMSTGNTDVEILVGCRPTMTGSGAR